MRFRFIVPVVIAAAIFAGDAFATPDGFFEGSGRQGFSCASCHSGATGSSIMYDIIPLDGGNPGIESGYVPGATYQVDVTVTGGPGVLYGFAWDADGGTGTLTDPVNTQINPNSNDFPANFTHTLTGNMQNSWSFEWTAPTDGLPVTFWATGNSVDGMSNLDGDAPTTTISFTADPILAPEEACRTGNVNANGGTVTDVLFLNGSAGNGIDRSITLSENDAFLLSMTEPPALVGNTAKFVLYIHVQPPNAGSVRTLPMGLGDFCKPIFLTDENPAQLVRVTNNIGKENALGESDFPSVKAPSDIVDRPNGVGKTGTFFFQGLIIDPMSPQGQAAVTNGIEVTLTP